MVISAHGYVTVHMKGGGLNPRSEKVKMAGFPPTRILGADMYAVIYGSCEAIGLLRRYR